VPEIDYGSLDYQRWTPLQRAVHWIMRFLVRLLTRVTVEGLENVPAQGAFVLAVNHLDYLDAPIVFAKMPRRTVVFAADKWAKTPFSGWILSHVGTAIYVERGAPDRKALASALTVLKAGGALAMAPEGTRSPTGGLTKGHTGVAYLATRSATPILPVVACGQEQSVRYWRRLRRVPVQIRIGSLIHLPAEKARTEQLNQYTEQLMLTLASMLPEQYQGVYGKREN
jgi:1-acyl-sn-glycerol-3-phosphate acyltransferase